jgi:hypothetical protein
MKKSTKNKASIITMLSLVVGVIVLLFGNNILLRMCSNPKPTEPIKNDSMSINRLKLSSSDDLLDYDPNYSDTEIEGHFNQDDNIDRLTYLILDKNNKIFSTDEVKIILQEENIDLDSMMNRYGQNYEKIPFRGVLMSPNDKKIPKLENLNPGGLRCIINEGDFDGDGIDEVSISQKGLYHSGTRGLTLYSLQNGKWKKLVSAMIACCPDKEEYNSIFEKSNQKHFKYYDYIREQENHILIE